MPADTTLSQAPSAHHGSASKPYQCSTEPNPPGAEWAIKFGYCRYSLDHSGPGACDPRCPLDCQHKAPPDVAKGFSVRFTTMGAVHAAAWARAQKEGS